MKKLNAGNDDESRMRAKRSIFDSTRLRYSSVFCSVASRVVTTVVHLHQCVVAFAAVLRRRSFATLRRTCRFDTEESDESISPRCRSHVIAHASFPLPML